MAVEINRRSFAQICTAAVAATAVPTSAESAASKPRSAYWRGDFAMYGAIWRIGVERQFDGQVVIDVPSLWRAGDRSPSGVSRGGHINLQLPYGIGRLEARIAEGILLGAITGPDGERATINLKEYPAARIQFEELRLKGDQVIVAGTLERPETAGPRPAIIVLHGGGDSSRADSPPYVFWGSHLAKLGFAALTYDKRGNGQSTGSWRTVGFDERAQDVVAIAEYLAGRRDIDPTRIGLLAVSQGGWVAARAARMSPRISFIAAISCPVVTPREADTYASWSYSRQSGLSSDEADQRTRVYSAYLDYVAAGGSDSSWQQLSELVSEARSKSWFAKLPFTPDRSPDPFEKWYPHIMNYNPEPDVAALRIPMLWMYGGVDTQSDPGKNVGILNLLRQRANPRIDVALLPKGDHGIMSTVPGRLRLSVAVPGFFDTIETWLKQMAVAA